MKLKFDDLADILLVVTLCRALSLAWSTSLKVDHVVFLTGVVALNYVVYAAVVTRYCHVKGKMLRLLSRATGRSPITRLCKRSSPK